MTPARSNLLTSFNQYLQAHRLSKKTIRNYRSDIRQFLAWLQQEIRSSAGLQPQAKDRSDLSITASDFLSYKSHLQSQKTPPSTLARHLASLRKFAHFLKLELNLSNPPLPLIPTSLKNFKNHLIKKRYKSKTVTNYISDVKHYLNWAQARINAKC